MEILRENGISGKILQRFPRKKSRLKSGFIFFAEHQAKTSVPHQRKVWCYPIQFALPCPRLPTVEF